MIRIENVTKRFETGFVAVDTVSFTVNRGEIFSLLGRSGCGKTTTLKMINRLVEYDSGAIHIKDKEIRTFNPIALRRQIGYVIQDIGLFPHMTIGANIATVPKLLKWDADRIHERLEEVIATVKLPAEMLERYPHQLSGGQKQRIGIARAIAADPDIILMDEPFGALDPITREELQQEFLNVQKTIRKTIVFITHDIYEAFRLGNQVAIMEKGAIVQAGTPYELISAPANDFVTGFMGRHRGPLAEAMDKGELS